MTTDVPVTHLNSRLALQLPAELPLGLVFVVGRIENLRQTSNKNTICTKFDLVEKEHSIQCELSRRAAEESNLAEGAQVRAGGHLAFDSHRARYFLLARDVETVLTTDQVAESPDLPTNGNGVHKALGRQALTPILADIKRRAEATNLEEAHLPYWVKKLAPPEVREELEQVEPVNKANTAVSPPPSPLDSILLSALSQAMDSDEEVELTSEMLAELALDSAPVAAPLPQNDPYQTPPALPPTSANQQNLTLAITILILALVLLAVLFTVLFTGA